MTPTPALAKTAVALGATASISCYLVWWITTVNHMDMEEVKRAQQLELAFSYANCLTLAELARSEEARRRCANVLDGGLQVLRQP